MVWKLNGRTHWQRDNSCDQGALIPYLLGVFLFSTIVDLFTFLLYTTTYWPSTEPVLKEHHYRMGGKTWGQGPFIANVLNPVWSVFNPMYLGILSEIT